MGLSLEIERKFLVRNLDCLNSATSHIKMRQGYLSTDPNRVVRLRLSTFSDDSVTKAYLTIKGPSRDHGLARLEWEKEVEPEQALGLFDLCLPNLIEKTRYLVPHQGFVFEVDVFEGVNKGLVVAEIELPEINTAFDPPSWLANEVTGQGRYTNAALTERPFTQW